MFLTQERLDYVKEAINGQHGSDLLLTELREFMKAEFDVNLYCYFCDGEGKSRRLLYLLNETDKCFFYEGPWNNRDLKKEAKIKDEFSRLCCKYDKYEAYKDPAAYFAIAEEFESDIRLELMNACKSSIESYLGTVEEVKLTNFSFDNVYIFYELDEHIKIHEEDGLSEDISERIFAILKKNDNYSVCKEKRVFFDSIQTLNEKYNGSLFNYLR